MSGAGAAGLNYSQTYSVTMNPAVTITPGRQKTPLEENRGRAWTATTLRAACATAAAISLERAASWVAMSEVWRASHGRSIRRSASAHPPRSARGNPGTDGGKPGGNPGTDGTFPYLRGVASSREELLKTQGHPRREPRGKPGDKRNVFRFSRAQIQRRPDPHTETPPS